MKIVDKAVALIPQSVVTGVVNALPEPMRKFYDVHPGVFVLIAANVLAGILTLAQSIVGVCDIRIWYSGGKGLCLFWGILELVLDVSLAYFLYDGRKWARWACLLFCVFGILDGVKELAGLLAGTDTILWNFFDLPIVFCDAVCVIACLSEDVKSYYANDKFFHWKSMLKWLAVWLVGMACAVPLFRDAMNENISARNKVLAIKAGGYEAKQELIDEVVEGNEGLTREEAEEEVNRQLGVHTKIDSLSSRNARHRNVKTLLALWFGALFLIGWWAKRKSKSGSEKAAGEKS